MRELYNVFSALEVNNGIYTIPVTIATVHFKILLTDNYTYIIHLKTDLSSDIIIFVYYNQVPPQNMCNKPYSYRSESDAG